jgi:hypothetical protein
VKAIFGHTTDLSGNVTFSPFKLSPTPYDQTYHITYTHHHHIEFALAQFAKHLIMVLAKFQCECVACACYILNPLFFTTFHYRVLWLLLLTQSGSFGLNEIGWIGVSI